MELKQYHIFNQFIFNMREKPASNICSEDLCETLCERFHILKYYGNKIDCPDCPEALGLKYVNDLSLELQVAVVMKLLN